MFKRLTFIALALFAIPAAAQTEHVVVGANPPAQYTVCAGDTLILKKPMGRDLLPDGSRASYASAWNDRARSDSAGNLFETVGATKLAPAGFIAGTGNVYRLLDAKPCASAFRFGANLSGAEAKGGDAVRPSIKDLRAYIGHGFKLIRYPFKPDRMTPARIAELRAFTDEAGSLGAVVILDAHTYKWTATPQEMVDQWAPLARQFPDDGSVMLDLVNEPRGFNDPIVTNDFVQWARDAKLIIAGLRANGIKHPIAIEYPQWSATFRFDKGERATQPCGSAGCALDRDTSGPLDPLDRTYINAHRYWDKGSSGTSKSCDATLKGSSGIDNFAAQLRRRGLKGIVTEAAFGSSYGINESCLAIGADAVADFKTNADVLYGVTWWGGGRVWPESYAFKIEPKKGTFATAPLSAYAEKLLGR